MAATLRPLFAIGTLLLLVCSAPADPQARTDSQGDPLPDGAVTRLGTIRFRAGNYLNLVALAPDGKSIAVGPNQGLRILDLATGKELRKMKTTGFLNANFISFSPDGKLLAALDFNGRIQFWNTETGDSTGQVAAPPPGAVNVTRNSNSVSFSGDGKYVAIGAESFNGQTKSSVIVYDVATGKQVTQVEPMHNGSLRTCFSGNGKLLVTAGQFFGRPGVNEPVEKQKEINQTIELWDPATGKDVRKMRSETAFGFVNIALSADGKQLAAAAQNGGIVLFDPVSGKEVRRLAGRRNMGTYLAFSPDGKTLAAGSYDGVVQTWDTASGKRLGLYGSPSNLSGRLAYTTTGKLLAYGTNGQSVFVRDVLAEKMVTPTAGHEGSVTSIQFRADSKEIVTAGTDGHVCVWDADGKEKRQLPLQGEQIVGAAPVVGRLANLILLPDGKHVLAAMPIGLSLFELTKGREVCSLSQNFAGGQMQVAFSADGNLLASAAPDFQNRKPQVHLYDVGSGQELRKLEGPLGNINSIDFSPDGKTLAVASTNFQGVQTTELRLFDTANGKTLWQEERKQIVWQRVALSPDGKTLAALEGSGIMTLFDAANGHELRKLGTGFGTGNASALSFSPDGRLVAVATYDFTKAQSHVRLTEIASGSVRHEFSAHDGSISALAFSSDGRRLATGGNDTTVLLWDLTATAGEEAPKSKPTAEELAKLWTALGDKDARVAHRALRRMEAAPEETLALLTKNIQSGGKGSDEDTIAKMIAALDSDSFDERQKAASDLAALGKAAETPLRKALKANPTAEARRAMTEILDKMKDTGGPPPELVRPLRVVELLENLGSPEAKKLLETIAKGAADAPGTAAAKAALERLSKP